MAGAILKLLTKFYAIQLNKILLTRFRANMEQRLKEIHNLVVRFFHNLNYLLLNFSRYQLESDVKEVEI